MIEQTNDDDDHLGKKIVENGIDMNTSQMGNASNQSRYLAITSRRPNAQRVAIEMRKDIDTLEWMMRYASVLFGCTQGKM